MLNSTTRIITKLNFTPYSTKTSEQRLNNSSKTQMLNSTTFCCVWPNIYVENNYRNPLWLTKIKLKIKNLSLTYKTNVSAISLKNKLGSPIDYSTSESFIATKIDKVDMKNIIIINKSTNISELINKSRENKTNIYTGGELGANLSVSYSYPNLFNINYSELENTINAGKEYVISAPLSPYFVIEAKKVDGFSVEVCLLLDKKLAEKIEEIQIGSQFELVDVKGKSYNSETFVLDFNSLLCSVNRTIKNS